MTDQQDDGNPQQDASRVGISIGGSVGSGSAVGPGASVRAINIAGGNISATTQTNEANNEAAGKTLEDFGNLLGDLRIHIEQARDAGELDEEAARTALEQVETASTLAKEERPPKKSLLNKLETVIGVLDDAVDAIEAKGGVARAVIKAVPIAALILKVANILF